VISFSHTFLFLSLVPLLALFLENGKYLYSSKERTCIHQYSGDEKEKETCVITFFTLNFLIVAFSKNHYPGR